MIMIVANVIAAIAALAAAFLWFKASSVSVPPQKEPGNNQVQGAAIITGVASGETDFIATAERQAFWNKWASIAACVAAVSQAVGLLMTPVSN